MEMTITRALAELKLLDKRITGKIHNTTFVEPNKKSADKVARIYTRSEFDEKVKSEYQSILDLIERRKKIKSAIVESNAITHVEIGGKTYTVAEAIERKNSIEYEKQLLATMKAQYKLALASVNRENERVQETLDKLLETMLGKEAKNVTIESNEMAKKYLEDNEYEIVDPLKIVEKIETLEKEIDEFESEVDFVLSESNTITKISIED